MGLQGLETNEENRALGIFVDCKMTMSYHGDTSEHPVLSRVA